MSKLGDALLDDFLERRDKMRMRDKETRREERMLKFHTEKEVVLNSMKEVVLKTFQQTILKYLKKKSHGENRPPL
jgi:hypothetical protein